MIAKALNISLLVCILFFLGGCSNSAKELTPSKPKSEKNLEEMSFLEEFEDEITVEQKTDLFEEYNRVMTSFNDGFYTSILMPVSKGYKKITPKQLRDSIANFFSNLFIPVSFVNNILQGEFTDASTELGRFVLNTTFGLGGLFDPAQEHIGLEPKKEDFGQTLGIWGVGSGPHIVLPILGPSNLRDMVALYPDTLINPVYYYEWRNYNLVDDYMKSVATRVFDKINYAAIHDGEYEKFKEDAIDLYPYFKNLYEQYRTNQIKE